MKNIKFLAGVALAALTLAACDKNESANTTTTTTGGQAITLTLTTPVSTKSAVGSGIDVWDADAASTTGYASVAQTLDIYFTNSADEILYAYTLVADAADAETTTDEGSAYTALTGGKSVRFVGMEGVSRVYVVANATSNSTLAVGDTMTDLSVDLTEQLPTAAQNTIIYVGADLDITPLYNEDATGVGTTLYTDDSELSSPDYYSQYYAATVAIRPIVSRFEFLDAGVNATGETEYLTMTTTTYDADGNVASETTDTYKATAVVTTDAEAGTTVDDGTEYYFKVAWSGFAPKLLGIYMSNFYGTIDPLVPSVAAAFETPDTVATPITAASYYLWSSECTAIYETAYNADGVTLYTNGDGSNLFTTDYGTVDDAYYYFKSTTACIPYNFFVPAKVGDDAQSTSAHSSFAISPKFHLLFDSSSLKGESSSYSYTINAYNPDTDELVGTVDKANNTVLYETLTADFNFETISDNLFYANIVNYYDASGSAVTIAPNTIYQMTDVLVSPYNLTATLVSEDYYNVVVTVTVLDYNSVSVTPEFD